MKVALFVPCYVDAFFPEVGIASLELLEKLGVEVDYPLDQTCCGQPMGNSGCHDDAAATEALFVRNFEAYERIVTPSGSCTPGGSRGLEGRASRPLMLWPRRSFETAASVMRT